MAATDLTPGNSRWVIARSDAVMLGLVPAALYYAFLLSAGGGSLFAPLPHGLTFNSMLLHLLHGRFDVDPAAIGDEGYLRDGAVYAYFGVFPALFRAAFLWLPEFARADFTRLSCLTAVIVMALFKLLSVRLVWRRAGARGAPALLPLMTAVILLAGPQIQFLRPSIYQEPTLWAGAFAAGFVYLALRGLGGEAGFSPRVLAGLALFAGLALLTRVSTACGLYAAFALVWGAVAWQRLRHGSGAAIEKFAPLAAAAAIAALFIAVTAVVNIGRWANPLIFMDLGRAIIFQQYPDRPARLHAYGQFNFLRLGYGLVYYFLPLWVLRGADGQFWWGDFQQRLYDGPELPPSSFFTSDPLLIGLAVFGAVLVWRERDALRRRFALLVGVGLFVPCLLMLIALGAAFRYRMEFYPFFELFAFLGFGALAARPATRVPFAVSVGAVASIVSAHLMWLLYMLSPFGPAAKVMGPLGIADFYRSLFN